MQDTLLYNELAYLWPVISPPEDYAEGSRPLAEGHTR